jgi:hypothetical protein
MSLSVKHIELIEEAALKLTRLVVFVNPVNQVLARLVRSS